jgi:hypothetical protein
MANPSWLDSVRKRLFRQGLPPSYVQRFMGELSDHLEDVKEENMEGDAVPRLGEPEEVAEAAVVAYRRRSFLGRHPAAAVLVFGVSPVVSLAALFAIAYVVLFAFLEVYERIGGNVQHFLAGLSRFGLPASVALPYVMSLLTIVIPCILASLLYCRLARRLALGKKWMLLSCVVLALLAALPICSVKLSGIPGENALRWGVWNPWGPQGMRGLPSFLVWLLCRPRQLIQFLVPLAIGCWLLRRKRERDRLQVAP